MLNIMESRFKNVILAFLFIYPPMWIMFFVESSMPGQWLQLLFGVQPRTLSFVEIFGVMGSWLSHGNYQHIMNNSISLAPLLFFVALLEKNIFRLLGALIFVSGFSTWLLGAPHSVHIGASGLVFALFGYILAALFISGKLLYLIPVLWFAGYYGLGFYSSFFHGLIPQEGISFAGHFGGLMGGGLVGSYYQKKKKGKIESLETKQKV